MYVHTNSNVDAIIFLHARHVTFSLEDKSPSLQRFAQRTEGKRSHAFLAPPTTCLFTLFLPHSSLHISQRGDIKVMCVMSLHSMAVMIMRSRQDLHYDGAAKVAVFFQLKFFFQH